MPPCADNPQPTAARRLVCLADDLTGAAEIAALAAGLGVRGTLVLSPDFLTSEDLSRAVCFVNLGCRQMSGPEAGARVRTVVGRIHQTAPGSAIFLKVDSAARGPIGYMLGELGSARPAGAIPIMLANPETGRATKDGVHYVDGKPLADSAFCNDPIHPARDSYLPSILAQGCGQAIGVWSRIQAMPDSGIHVINATDWEDVDAAARAWRDAALAAGSAAFLCALIRQQVGCRRPADQAPSASPFGRALIVLGTRHPNRESLRHGLIEYGGKFWDVSGAPQAGLNLPLVLECRGDDASPKEVEAMLADAAGWAIERLVPASLVIVGGETAQSILARLGVQRAEPVSRDGALAVLSARLKGSGREVNLLLMPGSYRLGDRLLSLLRTPGPARVV